MGGTYSPTPLQLNFEHALFKLVAQRWIAAASEVQLRETLLEWAGRDNGAMTATEAAADGDFIAWLANREGWLDAALEGLADVVFAATQRSAASA